jgi:hypothetical protein
MTKRRRTGAVFALGCRPPLCWRLRAALDAAVFRFNINYETRTIRFSSEKSMGDLHFADCGGPDVFTRPLARESWRLVRTPENRRGFILAAFAGKSSIIVTLSSLWGLIVKPPEWRVEFKSTNWN